MSFAGNTSLKNAPLSPASQALGLGDQLQTQVQNQIEEQKKKKLLDTKAMSNQQGALNPNSAGISAAVQSLLGNQ